MGAYADCPNYAKCENQMWIGEGNVGLCGECYAAAHPDAEPMVDIHASRLAAVETLGEDWCTRKVRGSGAYAAGYDAALARCAYELREALKGEGR